LTTLLASVFVALFVSGFESYGTALFVGSPFLLGVLGGFVFNRRGRRGILATLGVVTVAVVISSGGTATAMPFSVANSMMSADKLVIDHSRLKAAPKVKQGEWRSESSSSWKQEATRYWDRG